MIAAQEPAPYVKSLWRTIKYLLFPVGFLLLLGRVGVKLLYYALNKHLATKK